MRSPSSKFLIWLGRMCSKQSPGGGLPRSAEAPSLERSVSTCRRRRCFLSESKYGAGNHGGRFARPALSRRVQCPAERRRSWDNGILSELFPHADGGIYPVVSLWGRR